MDDGFDHSSETRIHKWKIALNNPTNRTTTVKRITRYMRSSTVGTIYGVHRCEGGGVRCGTPPRRRAHILRHLLLRSRERSARPGLALLSTAAATAAEWVQHRGRTRAQQNPADRTQEQFSKKKTKTPMKTNTFCIATEHRIYIGKL